jgi:hypothetical protein
MRDSSKERPSKKNQINVYFDDKEVQYQIESCDDFWVLVFNYTHIKHEILITFKNGSESI